MLPSRLTKFEDELSIIPFAAHFVDQGLVTATFYPGEGYFPSLANLAELPAYRRQLSAGCRLFWQRVDWSPRSVVSREYGIPAVVGVHEATRRLKSGQHIRLDGTTGQIMVVG